MNLIKVLMLISNPNKILTLSSIPILISKPVNSLKLVRLLLIYGNEGISEYVHHSYCIHIHAHNEYTSYTK